MDLIDAMFEALHVARRRKGVSIGSLEREFGISNLGPGHRNSRKRRLGVRSPMSTQTVSRVLDALGATPEQWAADVQALVDGREPQVLSTRMVDGLPWPAGMSGEQVCPGMTRAA